MSFGVVPEGFRRKPLATILSEIEQANVDTFGADVIQTSQSPLGQINGLMANLIAQLWEHAESVYQSHDVDQAEGTRLDTLGKLRLLSRATDEGDADYRQAITNADRARIDIQDITRAISGVAGVTYARTFVNDGDSTDTNGVPAKSVAIVVQGGDDETIGETIRSYVVPGIGTYGSTRTDVEVEGYCRTLYFTRAVDVDLEMALTVSTAFDRNGCPPPSASTIAAGIAAALNGDSALLNGDDVTLYTIQAIAAALYGRSVQVTGGTIGEVDDTAGLGAFPHTIGFGEIARFSADNIAVTIA